MIILGDLPIVVELNGSLPYSKYTEISIKRTRYNSSMNKYHETQTLPQYQPNRLRKSFKRHIRPTNKPTSSTLPKLEPRYRGCTTNFRRGRQTTSFRRWSPVILFSSIDDGGSGTTSEEWGFPFEAGTLFLFLAVAAEREKGCYLSVADDGGGE